MGKCAIHTIYPLSYSICSILSFHTQHITISIEIGWEREKAKQNSILPIKEYDQFLSITRNNNYFYGFCDDFFLFSMIRDSRLDCSYYYSQSLSRSLKRVVFMFNFTWFFPSFSVSFSLSLSLACFLLVDFIGIVPFKGFTIFNYELYFIGARDILILYGFSCHL